MESEAVCPEWVLPFGPTATGNTCRMSTSATMRAADANAAVASPLCKTAASSLSFLLVFVKHGFRHM